MNQLYRKGPRVPGLFVFALSALVYVFTLAPTFLHIDCGELAAAQATLGIAHPTGYPVFTLLGYLFLQLPLPLRPIVQSNLLAALCTAGGMGLIAAWLFRVLQIDFHKPDPKKKPASPPPPPCTASQAFWISVSSTLLLAFSLTVWAQATSVEVYSLHILLLAALLTVSFRAWQSNAPKDWVLTALVLGLAFSNHMTTLMALPLLAFLYLHRNGIGAPAFRGLLVPAAAGLGVLVLFYGFLFFRAGMDPVLAWGNIHDWTSFKRHITGHQYSTWMMAGGKVAARNLKEFLRALPAEWAFAGLAPILLGITLAFRSARILSWALTLGMVFNLFYVIQYDIKDLEPYFMLTLFGLAWFAAFGMKRFLLQLKKPALAPALLVFPALALALHFSASDQRKTTFFEDYTRSALDVLEPNALLITQQWDFLIPPYYYLRMVENQYPRLTVLDKELVRRSWYLRGQAPRLDSTLFKGAEPARDAFLTELKPFEEGRPYDGPVIEEAYQRLLGTLMIRQLQQRPVYIAYECVQNQEVRIPAGYELVPVAFWLKLVPAGTGYVPARIPVFKPLIPDNWQGKGEQGYYADFIRNNWNGSCRNRAQYEAQHGKPEEAQRWQAAVW